MLTIWSCHTHCPPPYIALTSMTHYLRSQLYITVRCVHQGLWLGATPALASSPLSSRAASTSTLRQADGRERAKTDVGTGVDPGYTAPIQDQRSHRLPSEASDPFPLPFSSSLSTFHTPTDGPHPGHEGVDLASATQSTGLPEAGYPLRVPGRENEVRTTKLARLVYQARKRGTLETDLLLATFAKKELHQLPDKELDEFDQLMDEPDWDIFYWCTNRKPVPPRWQESFKTPGRLGYRLRVHTRNDERAVRWMPDL